MEILRISLLATTVNPFPAFGLGYVLPLVTVLSIMVNCNRFAIAVRAGEAGERSQTI